MNFLYLMEYYPPIVMGGAETSGQDLVESLAKKHKVTVLTPNYQAFKTTTEYHPNLTIVRFRSPRYFLNKKRGASPADGKPGWYDLAISAYMKFSSWELGRKARKYKPDIIAGNNFESWMALGKIKTDAKKIAHIRDFTPFCYSRGFYHGRECDGIGGKNWCLEGRGVKQRILKWNLERMKKSACSTLNQVDTVIAISDFVKTEYENRCGLRNVTAIHDRVSTAFKSKKSKAEARKHLDVKGNVAMYAGGYNKKKGVFLVLELAKQFPDWTFLMAGSWPSFPTATANVKFMKNLSTQEIADCYRAADVTLFPSLWQEPLGRVSFEAAMNNSPVIGSKRGAIPEVIDELQCGVVVEPTVEAFARALKIVKRFKPVERKDDYIEKYLRIVG